MNLKVSESANLPEQQYFDQNNSRGTTRYSKMLRSTLLQQAVGNIQGWFISHKNTEHSTVYTQDAVHLTFYLFYSCYVTMEAQAQIRHSAVCISVL